MSMISEENGWFITGFSVSKDARPSETSPRPPKSPAGRGRKIRCDQSASCPWLRQCCLTRAALRRLPRYAAIVHVGRNRVAHTTRFYVGYGVPDLAPSTASLTLLRNPTQGRGPWHPGRTHWQSQSPESLLHSTFAQNGCCRSPRVRTSSSSTPGVGCISRGYDASFPLMRDRHRLVKIDQLRRKPDA